jgi:hypothetical protein
MDMSTLRQLAGLRTLPDNAIDSDTKGPRVAAALDVYPFMLPLWRKQVK